MTTRERATIIAERGKTWVTAVGAAGMVGFVGGYGLHIAGYFSFDSYLAVVGASSIAYGLALGIGHYGDPFAPPRRSSKPPRLRIDLH